MVKASGQQELGDTGGGRVPTGGRDEFGGQLHWLPVGDNGAVGGLTPTPGDLYYGNRLWGRGLEANFVVEVDNDQ